MFNKKFLLTFLMLFGGTMQLTANLLELTKDNKEEILKKSENKPVVIDFWAEWCQPCKQMSPIFKELSEEMKDSYIFAKADFTQLQDLAQKWNIKSLPTFVVIKNKEIVGRFSGLMNKQNFRKKIDEVFNPLDLASLTKEELSQRLSQAIQEGSIDDAKKIIKTGIVDLNEPFSNNTMFAGQFPLNFAFIMLASQGQIALDMIQLLLESGASPETEVSFPGNQKMSIKNLIESVAQGWEKLHETSKKALKLINEHAKTNNPENTTISQEQSTNQSV